MAGEWWESAPVAEPQARRPAQADNWWADAPLADAPPQPRQAAPARPQPQAPRQAPTPAQSGPSGYSNPAIEQQMLAAGLPPEEARRFATDPNYMGADWQDAPLDAPALDAPMPGFDAPAPDDVFDLGPLEGRPQAEINNAILAANLGAGSRVRTAGGEVVTLRSAPVVGEGSRQVGSGVFVQEPSLAEGVGAAASAASEQIPFLDETIAGTVGLLTGEGYQAARERQAQSAQYDREANTQARNLGGIGGFATGLLAPGAGFIARGPSAAYRASRAAAVGSGYGALYGAGSGEGGLLERGGDAAAGALVGGATGGLVQGGVDRLGLLASRAVSNPSPARQLSREGVSLTPGQMVEGAPLVGPMLRSLEDGASSIPFVGAPIAQARQQGTETFNRAVVNRALEPIGESLPRNARMGYEAIEHAQTRLSAAYEEALSGVRATLDEGWATDMAGLMDRAASELPEQQARQFGNILSSRVMMRASDDATLDGQQFKAVESELGALMRDYQRSDDPANAAMGRLLADARDALRRVVARQYPDRASRIQDINRGYANLVRAETAAGSSASQATGGVFTPTQLGMAVSRSGARSSAARGDNVLQDLAVAGRGVLPSTVGDSGTATRGAVTGLLGAVAAGVPVANTIAAPLIATGVAYSRPAQAALNAIYRRTDNPGAASKALADLGRLAQRNPALQPYYLEAARHMSGGLLGAPRDARTPAPRQAQGTQGLLAAQ